MTTISATEIDPDVFRGDLHGFILYPASWAKPHGEEFTPTRELNEREYRKHTGATPVQLAMPRQLGGTVFASPNQSADPMRHMQAASKLFGKDQLDFATAADDASRRYLGLGDNGHEHYTHLHGIGSWENNVEPAMTTVFHRPITGMQLQKIGADVGSWARQHGILVFSPHADGVEHLLHMRAPTHFPGMRLNPMKVAEISHRVTDLFNRYHDQGDNNAPNYWMPGRTILPDETGHSDILVWVPPWEGNPGRIHDAFNHIAEHLGVMTPPQYWPGTGMLLGGTSPYSDEETAQMSDDQKRDAAIANYKRVIAARESLLHDPQPTFPMRFDRAPAHSGAVVRGVYYPPGEITPNVVEQSKQPTIPPLPVPPMPEGVKHHPKMNDLKKRVMDAYNRKRRRSGV